MAQQQAATEPPEPTSGFVECEGIKLHYLDWGGDPKSHTFLLLHGGAAHVHWWDSLAPLLVPYGRVVALDFRGHGKSAWADPPHYGPGWYTRDVKGMIDHLGVRVILVGHSMGGAVAQWVATTYPELLEAMVLIDAPNGPPPLMRRLKWRWRRRSRGGPRPELRSFDDIKRKFRLSPPETYLTKDDLERLARAGSLQLENGNWAFRLDPRTRAWRKVEGRTRKPKIKSLAMPVLILRGAQSTLIGARPLLRMHRKIRGSIYKEIPRAYHHVPLDNPRDTAAAVIEFTGSL
ncbi:MAG TPA: alpha/beta hydrolase [Candidatus Binataceae bacterium]|nr:alpha/beta hydrolase [Candidatus Binataceae bacterium]